MYFVIFRLEEDKKIRVGKLGEIDFRKGYYVYVGSAKRGLNKRIRRHMKKEKRMRWHVDYLSVEAEFVDAFKVGVSECELAKLAASLMEGIKDFGCSDCKCKSHLFYSEDYPEKFVNEVKLNYGKIERLDYEELRGTS